MNLDLVMRSGKHTGKTLRWVQENDLGYLNWVEAQLAEYLFCIQKDVGSSPTNSTIGKRYLAVCYDSFKLAGY